MADPRLITVAIHTYDRALSLKSLLEREGVSVTLQNVNLDQPVVSSGIRMRIKESDLPLALRIIENQELFSTDRDSPSDSSHILVPVDFSDGSLKACQIAFHLAYRQKASIVLLHSFSNPANASRLQLDDAPCFDEKPEETDRRAIALKNAEMQMREFSDRLLDMIREGLIPGVKFQHLIVEGLPEDSINEYARERKPILIVMGTRGADKKEREMLGSVTAEVLDTCRYPIFTVPESVELERMKNIDEIMFFSNFDQEDILALDALFHNLPYGNTKISLVKIPTRKNSDIDRVALDRLKDYCCQHYPGRQFTADSLTLDNLEKDFSRITEGRSINLIAVPNKKKNIFARLFNPGIAHRLLFQADIPMMVIPV